MKTDIYGFPLTRRTARITKILPHRNGRSGVHLDNGLCFVTLDDEILCRDLRVTDVVSYEELCLEKSVRPELELRQREAVPYCPLRLRASVTQPR